MARAPSIKSWCVGVLAMGLGFGCGGPATSDAGAEAHPDRPHDVADPADGADATSDLAVDAPIDAAVDAISDAASTPDAWTRDQFLSMVGTFCDARSRHLCAALARTRQSYAPEDQCVSLELGRCRAKAESLAGKWAAGKLRFNPQHIAACHAELDDPATVLFNGPWDLPACKKVWTGAGYGGASCTHDEECLYGLCIFLTLVRARDVRTSRLDRIRGLPLRREALLRPGRPVQDEVRAGRALLQPRTRSDHRRLRGGLVLPGRRGWAVRPCRWLAAARLQMRGPRRGGRCLQRNDDVSERAGVRRRQVLGAHAPR
jgi:hypothetical protein